MNKINVDCKFKENDLVVFETKSNKESIKAYTFGVIEHVEKLERKSYSNEFRPVYRIKTNGGGLAFEPEDNLMTTEDFERVLNNAKERVERKAKEKCMLDEVAPPPQV